MSNRRIDTIVAIKINLYNIRLLSIFVYAPLRYLRQLRIFLKLRRKHDNVLPIVAFQSKAFLQILSQDCATIECFDTKMRPCTNVLGRKVQM